MKFLIFHPPPHLERLLSRNKATSLCRAHTGGHTQRHTITTNSDTWPCRIWPRFHNVSGLQWDFLSPLSGSHTLSHALTHHVSTSIRRLTKP